MTRAAALIPPIPRAEALKGHAAMFVFALCISGSFTLGHPAAQLLPPAALNAARFVLGVAVLGAAVQLGPGPGLRRDQLRAAWRYPALGALLAAYFILMFAALRLTDPVSTAAVFTLTPVMSAAVVRATGGRTAPALWLALGLGAAGALWVIFRGDWGAFLRLEVGRGEWLYFIGCTLHAIYPVLVRRWKRDEPPMAFAFWTMASCGTLICLAALVDGIPEWEVWAGLPAQAWGAIVYLAVFPTALTGVLLQYAAVRLHAGAAMAYGYLVPSLVMALEGLIGGGWEAPHVWIGAGLTIAATLLLLRKG